MSSATLRNAVTPRIQLTNPAQSPAPPPSIATCVRCGKEYNPAAGGDALFCADCAATQPRVSVTTVLIAINGLVFIAMALAGVSPLSPTSQDLLTWGASYGPLELSTEWWRLFTAMFVHIGVIHIALNMYCLWSLGPLAERLFGRWKFLSLYLLSGVGGNVLSVALHPTLVAAGASGAIFGVAGALLPVLHLRDIPAIVNLRGRRGRLGIGGFIAYNLIYGFANTGIDNAAHIGGLITGFAIGYTVPIAGSHAGRAAVWRTQGMLIATAVFLLAAFLGVRAWRHGYAELESGRRAFLAGNYAQGIAQLQSVLRNDPGNTQAHVLLGAAYLDEDSAAAAIKEFQLALRQDSTNTFALANLGNAYWRLGQWNEAAAAYTRATRVDPSDAAAWENLGGAFLNADRAADAIVPLEAAVALEPDTARTNYNLGLAYLKTQKYAAALTSFHHALRLKPNDPLALLRRGYTYERLGQVDSARADYQRVLGQPEGTVSDQTRADARRLLDALPPAGRAGRH